MELLSALIIDEPWIDMIMDGYKTWEIRSKNTTKRGLIGLIRKGSKKVVGAACIQDVIKITPSLAKSNYKLTGLTRSDAISCTGNNAWILEDAFPFDNPIPYIHTNQVIWVILDRATTKKVLDEIDRIAES